MEQNKTVLITGASSGIGKEIAIQLAKQNIKICINFSKSKEKAEEVQQEIEKFGGKAVIFQADISKEDEVKKMFDFVLSKFGALDILINNAGIDIPESIETYNYENWKKIFDVNLNGKFLCTKYAISLLKKSSAPRIINIASRFALKPFEEASAYCCAESGIVMFTQVSAIELSKYNIKVNTISPGLTKTPLTENICTEEDFDNYAKRNPSKRIGKPSDIANAVLFLISSKSEFINGENINVSGGILLK
ncbi:MAG: SDR family oxidoreductase [Candidatus Aenigmarchaeota archaeon]|nr:SDR family oxidoreductase [Candidatus Aenigmarchaeota archaeon]